MLFSVKHWMHLLKRLARDRKGATVLVWAFALVPILIGVGASVDISRAYLAKSRLEMALDTAGLAAAAGTTTEAEIQEIAQKFFEANYPDNALGTPGPLNVSIEGSKILLSANAALNPIIMQAFGYEEMQVAAVSEVTRQGLEVVLVLDNTGSMRGSKMASLRQASQDFLDIVFASPDLLTNLKVGIVPYSAAVNVGAAAPDLLTMPVGPGVYDPTDEEKWKGCLLARSYPDDVQDTDMISGNKWERYLWPSGADNLWPPTDTDPDLCNDGTGPNLGCPTAITPLTNDQDVLNTAVDDLEAWCRGGTFSNIGMMWGWRVLSPELPFDEGLDYDTPGFNKAAILMTDGVNGYYKPPGSPFTSDYSAYERVSEGNLGTTSKSASTGILNNRLAETCENMKAEGILIYTITFNLSNGTTKNLYRDCATDDDMYFDSPSGADLSNTFKEIANRLVNLRVSK